MGRELFWWSVRARQLWGAMRKGRLARAGGRGPWFSDEGSAFDIGRLAVAAVVRADEKRGRRRSFPSSC